MGGTEKDSYPKSKEKFQQQLQDIFQTALKLTGPDHFDQLCQWMEYKQYLSIDEFYESSYNDPDKFDTKGPATGSFPELCIYFAFGHISFHLHYICISFAFRIPPRISIFALHFISI